METIFTVSNVMPIKAIYIAEPCPTFERSEIFTSYGDTISSSMDYDKYRPRYNMSTFQSMATTLTWLQCNFHVIRSFSYQGDMFE